MATPGRTLRTDGQGGLDHLEQADQNRDGGDSKEPPDPGRDHDARGQEQRDQAESGLKSGWREDTALQIECRVPSGPRPGYHRPPRAAPADERSRPTMLMG
jgi:hypothetical protein